MLTCVPFSFTLIISNVVSIVMVIDNSSRSYVRSWICRFIRIIGTSYLTRGLFARCGSNLATHHRVVVAEFDRPSTGYLSDDGSSPQCLDGNAAAQVAQRRSDYQLGGNGYRHGNPNDICRTSKVCRSKIDSNKHIYVIAITQILATPVYNRYYKHRRPCLMLRPGHLWCDGCFAELST